MTTRIKLSRWKNGVNSASKFVSGVPASLREERVRIRILVSSCDVAERPNKHGCRNRVVAFSVGQYDPATQKPCWITGFRVCSEFAVKCRRDTLLTPDGAWLNGLICPFEYSG